MGEGAACELSLFAAIPECMSNPVYSGLYRGRPPPRTGTSDASIAPYGSFRTGDGRTVQLGVQNDGEGRGFCEQVLGQPQLAAEDRFVTNAHRVEHWADLASVIEAVFAELTADEVVVRLDVAQIASARLNDVGELIEHPQLAARARWGEVGSPVGPIRALRPPVHMEGVEDRMDPIPALAEHTDALLA